MAGTIVVDRIESDSSYASSINVASTINVQDFYVNGYPNQPGYKNKFINGDMSVAQLQYTSNTASVSGITNRTVDHWGYYNGLGGTPYITSLQSSDIPSGTGFANSWSLTVSSTPTNNTVFTFSQTIEGTYVRDCMWGTAQARPLTISFWCKSNKTGIYSLECGQTAANSAKQSCYVSEYTISQADTWEYKTITIPGDSNTGRPTPKGNEWAIYFEWFLCANKTQFASTCVPNTWQASPAGGTNTNRSSPNVTNTFGTAVGDYFKITGIQAEYGTRATAFEFLPKSETLRRVQRYYVPYTLAQTQTWGYGHTQTTNLGRITLITPVPMRTTPTFSNTATMYVISTAGSAVIGAPTIVDYTGTNAIVEVTAVGITNLAIAYGYAGTIHLVA